MPKVGFRTSIFGFHKDDVIEYLNQTHQEHTLKEQQSLKQISDLQDKLKQAEAKADEQNARLEEMEKEVSYYRGKEAEIEKMSISIGTMYLVAKQNSDEMIAAAEKYAADITEYSKRQLEAANKAGEQLNILKSGVSESAEKFAADLAGLTESLSESRERLASQLQYLELASSEVLVTDGSSEE